ncbi:lytic transglycosylase domain-containing protein [Streptomyces sp. JW3]|uniref:lytic transglycosylase domain-containing protein n=1 Tax=Streptomyces sp. JW3 TaxID=3456955 RepID=UPI003FA43096
MPVRAFPAAVVTVFSVLLTAGSQAPGAGAAAPAGRDEDVTVPGGFVPPDAPLPDVPSQGDDSYHVELPPLKAAGKAFGEAAADEAVTAERAAAEAGLPATVLTAYRRAETSLARTDPGCALPWQLLAGIGKVESGHARGGAVDAHGDTLTPITGPALDGDGFALIRDSEGGVWDGDAVYDRAVGPMQFLPTTWKTWGADGNGDGAANPNNIYDAALAAGHYLCAGDRDLRTGADLDRAILSYNHSRDYLNTVLSWMEFYRRGVRTVPDGTAVVPKSPGAGGDTPATRPVTRGGTDRRATGDDAGGTGTGAGGTPGSAKPTPTPSRTTPTTVAPKPTPTASADPTPTAPTTPEPEPDPDPTTDPTTEPSASPDPTDAPSPEPTPTPTPTVTPTDSGSPSPAAEATATTG